MACLGTIEVIAEREGAIMRAREVSAEKDHTTIEMKADLLENIPTMKMEETHHLREVIEEGKVIC